VAVLLSGAVARHGGTCAVRDRHGATTWRELDARVNRWIDVLAGCGLGAGDVVAAVLTNRREAVELLLAGLHAGVTVVPVNWHLTAAEIAYLLADSGARAVIADDPLAPVVARALESAGVGCPVRLVTGARPAAGFAAVEPLLDRADPGEPAGQSCGAIMLYTSGTTGTPKGVVNGLFTPGEPFQRVDRLLGYANRVLGVPADGRVLLDGPWYHSAQLFFALLALLQGSRVVIHERFDPAATLATIDREAITACHLVPTQFVRMLRLPDEVRAAFRGDTLDRVWHGGGPCPIPVKRRMIDWWGPVFVEYYAATEGGIATLIDSAEWLGRPGSVGQAVHPNRILVVDDAGAVQPAGQTGRIFVRRFNGTDFHYHNAPDKTRAAHLAAGVFTYGELGHLDADGYLYLTGRAQELIVTGGVNVYPAEVEAVLGEHPAVRDVAVLGRPDPEFGERVVAVVALDPDPASPDDPAEMLDRHCRRSLAGFKVPRRYHFVAAVPRDPSGKVRREALYDVLATGSARSSGERE
jgi:long-chain acyl-CoA synthetase